MKECDQARRLGAYHDGELPAAQREPIESHLAGCPSCRTELRGIAAMSDLLRTAAGADVPPGLLERLHEAVEALRDRLVRRFAYRVAAAAAAVLLACAVWLWHGDAPQPTPTPASDWERIALGSGEGRSGELIDQLAVLIRQDLAENDRDVH